MGEFADWFFGKILFKRSTLELARHLDNNELHWAVIYDSPEQVKELLDDEKISRHEKNRMGLTPLRLAQLLNRRKCWKLLDPLHEEPKIQIQQPGEKKSKILTPKEFEKEMEVEWLSTVCFESFEVLMDVYVQCLRVRRDKLLNQEAIWLGSFYRTEIEHCRSANVMIKWIHDDIGYGCFAMENIRKGAYVGEYTGRVFRRSPFDWRKDEYCFRYPSSVQVRPKFSIDAHYAGNFTRYINHSAEPNCEAMGVLSGELMHIILRAFKPILKGQQLTFDYGPVYWRWKRKKKIIKM